VLFVVFLSDLLFRFLFSRMLKKVFGSAGLTQPSGTRPLSSDKNLCFHYEVTGKNACITGKDPSPTSRNRNDIQKAVGRRFE
jgi:hypothetical protein